MTLLERLCAIVDIMDIFKSHRIISSAQRSELLRREDIPPQTGHEFMSHHLAIKNLRVHIDALREMMGGVITDDSCLIFSLISKRCITITIEGQILGQNTIQNRSNCSNIEKNAKMLECVLNFFKAYPDKGLYHEWHFEPATHLIQASTIHRAMLKYLIIKYGVFHPQTPNLSSLLKEKMEHIHTPTLFRNQEKTEDMIDDLLKDASSF